LEDQVTLITAEGMALRTSVESLARQGRTARGRQVMDLQDGDTVASVARLEEDGGKGEG
jgi:DNA gyrase subunit A